MSDGDTKETEEALAQAQAKEKELAEKLAAAEKRVEDAQEMIQRQSAEVGDDRKAIKESNEAIRKLSEEVLEASKALTGVKEELAQSRGEIAELKQKGPTEGDGNTQKPPPQKQDEEKTADEIESELSDDENKVLDEAWKRADEATRKVIKSDDKKRKEFLLEAKKAAVAEAASDLTDWRRKTPAKEDEQHAASESDMAKLFRTEKERVEEYPDGHGGGTARAKPRRMGLGSPKKKLGDGWIIDET